MSHIRIAYTCEFPTLLGGERSLLTFLAHRAEAAIDPIVVAPPGGRLAEALHRLDIRRIDWPAGGRGEVGALALSLGAVPPDMIHANSLMTADVAVAVGTALGIPAVAHVRDIMRLSPARMKRLRRLDAWIAVSEAVATWLRNEGVPADKVVRVYNAVDVESLQSSARPTEFRASLGVPADVPLIACIGQVALRKGQDLFLNAAAIVAGRRSDVQFAIVGERYSAKSESIEYELALHQVADRPPLARRVHFAGYRDDVPSVLADSDVLVVPSRQEPLSRALLEGLAMGTACIATDVGGSREILGDDEVGILVEPDDPEAISQAIISILDDAECRRTFEQRGPALIRREFDPRRQATAIGALYERIRTRQI